MTLEALKEKIDTLEKQMLAIDSLNNITQEILCNGNNQIKLDSCAELLNSLIEPAMFKVEETRMLIDSMLKAAQPNSPK